MQTLALAPTRKPTRVVLNRLADVSFGRPTAHDRSAVLQAVAEGRDIPERTVDAIVDKLLKELSW